MKKIFWLVCMMLWIVAGCTLGSTGPTGDTSTDPSAAQQFLPNLSGYTRSNAENLTSAISSVSGGAALLSGNPALAVLISRLDTTVQCYQKVGAVAAAIYTQVDIGQVIAGQIPKAGVVAVINQDRLSNFLNCVIGGGALSAQSAGIEPCGGSGSKVINSQTITYLYGGRNRSFCASAQQYFDSLR